MSAITPPLWMTGESHPGATLRMVQKGLLGHRGGIFRPTDLAVTQNGTPNMSVNVAEGMVAVPGTENTYQGTYVCEAQGTTNVTIEASEANPRIDLIVAQVRDADYSGADSDFRIVAVKGTAAASPSAPTTPDNSWVLAQVAVAASATSITTANITDRRTNQSGQHGLAAPAGFRVICTSTTRPTSPWEGMEIFETDTDKVYIYDGSAWVCTAYAGALDTYTPTLTQSVTVSKTVSESSYRKIGRWVEGHVILVATSGGSSGNGIQVGLPFAVAGSGNVNLGTGWVYDASSSIAYHGALLGGSGGTVATIWATGLTNNVGQTPSMGLATSDQISYSFRYRTS